MSSEQPQNTKYQNLIFRHNEYTLTMTYCFIFNATKNSAIISVPSKLNKYCLLAKLGLHTIHKAVKTYDDAEQQLYTIPNTYDLIIEVNTNPTEAATVCANCDYYTKGR